MNSFPTSLVIKLKKKEMKNKPLKCFGMDKNVLLVIKWDN